MSKSMQYFTLRYRFRWSLILASGRFFINLLTFGYFNEMTSATLTACGGATLETILNSPLL
jgi:hypothetical protein